MFTEAQIRVALASHHPRSIGCAYETVKCLCSPRAAKPETVRAGTSTATRYAPAPPCVVWSADHFLEQLKLVPDE